MKFEVEYEIREVVRYEISVKQTTDGAANWSTGFGKIVGLFESRETAETVKNALEVDIQRRLPAVLGC